ncbi:MAG: ParA family protein [Candidatus Glassbacteria bacterium]|nr:ParA family protein [Candidatus Glassbacteria bacterium]
MAISISFINMKGGVGKTTLAIQVAHAADRADYKTLAVDLDPQANLSQALLTPEKYIRHRAGLEKLYSCLSGEAALN